MPLANLMTGSEFQSTLSMRRATITRRNEQALTPISIHALHEESDFHMFLLFDGFLRISIHALHEESDHATMSTRIQRSYFNPRSP